MTISFAPLRPDAVRFLMDRTGIDYSICDFTGPQWFCCTARDDEGALLGVFIGEFQVWFECHISCAIRHPRFLTRRLLYTIFSTLFSRAVRLTALVRPDNEPALRIIRHLGFYQEGFMRFAIEGKWDANLFGMLRHECRYLGKMRPPLPQLDLADRGLSNSEPSGDLLLPPSSLPDPTHLLSRQLGHLVMLAALVIPVPMAFGNVVLPAGPAQMARIDAGTNAATMSGVISVRGGTVSDLANDPVSLSRRATVTQLSIPARISRQGPDQAVVTVVVQSLQEKIVSAHLLNIQEV